MNYQQLVEKIADGFVPVAIIGYMQKIDSVQYVGILHAKLIKFSEENSYVVLNKAIPIMVITENVAHSGSVNATGSIFCGTSGLVLADYVETPEGVNYFAEFKYLTNDDLYKLEKKFDLQELLNEPDTYFGDMIVSALKETEFNRSIKDLVWDAEDRISLGVELAKTASSAFKKYLNSYCKTLSKQNQINTMDVLDRFAYILNDLLSKNKKPTENKIVRIIESISPLASKSLKGINKRRKLSTLLVSELGGEVFKFIAKARSPYDLAARIIDELTDAEFEQYMSNIKEAFDRTRFVTSDNFDNFDSWFETYAVACKELYRIEMGVLSIFAFVTDRIDLGDIDEVSKAITRMDASISPLAVIENNPYILKYYNSSIPLKVLDFFACASGLIGRELGVKTNIVLNMRKSLAMEEFFMQLAESEGSTVYEITGSFTTDKANLPNKSVFDITISYNRAKQLLLDAGCDQFIRDAGLPQPNISRYFANPPITDTLLETEREALKYIFGDIYRPCRLKWTGRGILQFSGDPIKNKNKQITLVQTDGKTRMCLLNICAVNGGLCGISVNDKILFGTTQNFENECLIFDGCTELMKNEIKTNEEEIEQAIEEFEAIRGFKLEQRQAEGVRNCTSPVLAITGPAGSGKTTVAEAVIYALEKVRGDKIKIAFAAPTGMAATRLRQVVNRPVSTLHSLLKIAGDDSIPVKLDCDVLVVDECSMITSSICAKIFASIDWSKTQLIMLGDIEQLAPIGAGKPFAEMLEKKYIPTVALNVVKRCADGSSLTKNANIIIGTISGRVETDEEYRKFIVVDRPHPMNDKDYSWQQSFIVDLVKHHIGQQVAGIETKEGKAYLRGYLINENQFDQDGIYVVTPQKRNHQLGSDSLNLLLQPVFNPADSTKREVYYGDGATKKTFRVGDRVIHMKNIYSKPRYIIKVDEMTNEEYLTEYPSYAGIMNGEIGRIKFIVETSSIDYRSNPDIDAKVEARIVNDFESGSQYAVGVEYKDTDLNGEAYSFIILYMIDSKDKDIIDIHQMDVYGELSLLDHAYALTTHKMQGSQCKLAIVPVFSAHTGLMSKNMVYTALTRSKDTAYLIGDIYAGSTPANKTAFEQMLSIQAISKRSSLLGELMSSAKKKTKI